MIPKENPPLTEGFNEEEIAQNRVIFCQKIKKKVKENIQDFIKTAYASTKDSIYCYSWKRAIKRLIRKYKLALKLKYFFIFLFAHRNYQCYRKKNENFFLLRRPYELLKACHEEFLFKLTEINNEKRLEEQRTNYVRSKEDFEKEIFKIKDEIVAGFSKMFDESSCLLNNLPVRMIKKTYAIQKKNKQLLSRYCETICDEKWLPTRFKVKMTKTSNGDKLYSVKKARKQIEKIAKNLEKTYWRYEVKKVNLLNKTPKKQTNLPSFTNDGLYLKDVFKFYTNGVHTFKVLDNINLEIKFGEFVVIFGPSGSGKTTLLNIISGIDRASSGYVYCDGVNLTELSDKLLTKFRRKNVGYIFQQYSLLPNLTAKENVEIGANLQKNYRLKIDVNLLLNDVGMLDKKDSLPVELSGGQQQRISIARAIAKNPLIIFADEPTAALDSNATKTIMNLFTNLNKKYKTTFVVVSHNELFEELADKLIRVGDGKIESIAIKKKC